MPGQVTDDRQILIEGHEKGEKSWRVVGGKGRPDRKEGVGRKEVKGWRQGTEEE